MNENEDLGECELCKQFKVPNAETIAAIRELDGGGGVSVASVQELLVELGSE